MHRHAFAAERHRLLEAFVLRLARDRESDAFALRGGMCVKKWLPSAGRVAGDVDLVCALPHDADDLRARMHKVLTDDLHDGVEFYPRFRLDSIWPDDAHPGMRLVAQATVDGEFDELHVDLTFNLPIFPSATRMTIGEDKLWVCPPAMIVGRKLRVTSDLGQRFWRPKDLGDLLLLLRHHAPDTRELGDTIERSFLDDHGLEHVGEALNPKAWASPYAARRWSMFAAGHRELELPREVQPAVDELRALLSPVLRGAP